MNTHQHKILIIDFGSQYTQLIARRVREAGVYSEIMPFDVDEKHIKAFGARGIILSGGPESVTEIATPRVPEIIFNLNLPVLGICYGMQAMAEQLGGKVEASDKREFGHAKIELKNHSQLFHDIEDEFQNGKSLLNVWMSHGDHVVKLPPNFQAIASTHNAPIAAMADEKRHFYGLQFHPEVTHTLQGQRIISRFLFEICGCETSWTTSKIIEEALIQIKDQVKNDHVLLALSGGVDSSVVAALLHRAIGKQLHCVFVDTGLLRENEGAHLMKLFHEHFHLDVTKVDAAEEFLMDLKNVDDPEQKRKIIGRKFIEIFERNAKKIPEVKWLAQGTIYPDVVESAATKFGKSHVIKTHHNVGGLPEKMHLKLLEPLRELFKDEVRKLGLELGLPRDLLYRHPFPGPGLAVRILGNITPEAVEIVQRADTIFTEVLKQRDWYQKVDQAFVVYLPVKSVGVMGDSRRYDPVLALRAVQSVDFMTAHSAALPFELLQEVAHRIVNEVKGVSRVVYDVTGKPPATIEWE